MNPTDILLLIIRWLHAMAAVAWVGGSIFYLLILRPNLRTPVDESQESARAIAVEFRGLVTTSIGILIVTGAILAFSRLTAEVVGISYIVVLSIKVALAFYMFYLVRFLRRKSYSHEQTSTTVWGLRRLSQALTGTTVILVLGIMVFLLSDLLKVLFEKGLES